MEPSDQYPKSFVTTMPGLGDDDDQEELCDMRLAGISFILEEGDTEDYVAFQQEHVANEGEEGEGRGGGQDGSIAPGSEVGIYPEGGSFSGGGHFLGQQLRELFAAAAFSPPAVNRREENFGHTTLTLAQPGRTTLTPTQPGLTTVTPAQPGRTTLTPAQLQELESIFQHRRYLNKAARLELAKRMNVTEAKLQVWFKNRRARWRRRQRAFRSRNQLPEIQDDPVNTTSTVSSYSVRAWDQNRPSVTPSLMSFWQPRFPQVPMSEPMLMPEPQPMAASVPQPIPLPVPRHMPSSVPYRMPLSVPQSMPLPVPHHMPPSFPHLMSLSVSQSMPLSVPQSMPLSVPQSMPPSVPHCMPLSVPQPTPPSVPQNMAPSVPQPMLPLVPMLVPVLMPEPQPMPLSVPQPVLTLVPMLVPVMMPEPQAMPLSVPPPILTLVPMSVHMLVPEPQPMQLPVPPLIQPPVPPPMLPLAPPSTLPPVPSPHPPLFLPPPLLYVIPVTHFIQDLCGRIWFLIPVYCVENNFN